MSGGVPPVSFLQQTFHVRPIGSNRSNRPRAGPGPLVTPLLPTPNRL